ncbi:MAG: NADH-quinone oxidoreductase subunit L [Terriglobales bacterium]
MNPSFHLWLIPAVVAAGAAINGLLGRRFSKPVVTLVALTASGAAFAWAVVCAIRFFGLPEDAIPHVETYATWIRVGTLEFPCALMLDQLSLVMVLVVTGVGFLIHIYSVGYMAHEGGYYRFFSYMNLFMFFMLTLVLSNNYLLMFVGWEGVGLASYLLIGFFFLRDSAAAAGKKAFIVNRVGDFGFLIALFLMIQHFGTLTYAGVFEKVTPMPVEAAGGLLTAIGILLMVGACGKSAQLPLYVWLPDAMEGPTPVSALIHAATMVTAGVYMVARSNPIFFRSPAALMVVAIIGVLTALYAATIGITQTDIKRVLAYSTISQLGFMFTACGVAAFGAGIFHLMTHAFFKALLFLGAGSVIHALGGEQDMRRMGGLRTHIPWTFWTMLMATLAIAGIPGFSGFFSKDEILWNAYASPWGGHWVYWAIGALTAGITSFYMFRLVFLTFFGEFRGAEAVVGEHAGHAHAQHGAAEHGHIHESPKVMIIPLAVLAVLSVIGGYVGVPSVLGGANHFEHFLKPILNVPPVTEHIAHEGGHTLELLLMSGTTIAALIGFFFAWLLYYRRPELPDRISESLGSVYRLVRDKYRVDELYAALFVNPLINGSSKLLWRGLDASGIDGVVNGAARGAREVSDVARHMQSGLVRSYAGWVVLGAVAVVIYMLLVGAR